MDHTDLARRGRPAETALDAVFGGVRAKLAALLGAERTAGVAAVRELVRVTLDA